MIPAFRNAVLDPLLVVTLETPLNALQAQYAPTASLILPRPFHYHADAVLLLTEKLIVTQVKDP